MFGFSNLKRLLSYDSFFYKSLTEKLYCFPPIQLPRHVTTNLLQDIASVTVK